MNKKDIQRVDLKPRWNFIAKFYFICIIIFVFLVISILVYRHVNLDRIQNNTSSHIDVSKNEIKENNIKFSENNVANINVNTEETIKNETVENNINSQAISKETSVNKTQQVKKIDTTPNVYEKVQEEVISHSTTTNNTQIEKKETIIDKQEIIQEETTEETNQFIESFKENNEIINQMKDIISNNESMYMKEYGYNIVVDKSIVNKTTGFTYTETRVKNAISNSFGTIRIYARNYYVNNNLQWIECYIL